MGSIWKNLWRNPAVRKAIVVIAVKTVAKATKGLRK